MKSEQAENTHKVFVWKSADPSWTKYAVGETDRHTRWFDTYEAASRYADERARINKCGVFAR